MSHLRNLTHAFPYGQEPSFPTFIGRRTAGVADLAMDLTGQVQGGYGLLSIADVESRSKALQVLNFTTCLSVITGPVLLERSIHEIHLSDILHDFWGRVKAGIQVVRGGLQTAGGGLCILPASALSCMLFFTASKAASVAKHLLTSIGSCLFGIASLLQIVSSTLELWEAWEHRTTLTSKGSAKEALQELQKQLNDPALLRGWMRSVDPELLNEAIEAPLEQAEAIIERVLNAQAKEMAVGLFTLALSVTGIALTILGLCLTGGGAPFILGVAGSILGFIWLTIDLKGFIEMLSTENVALYEKPLLYLSAVFCMLIIAGASFFARKGLGLYITIAAGILLVLLHFCMIARAHFP